MNQSLVLVDDEEVSVFGPFRSFAADEETPRLVGEHGARLDQTDALEKIELGEKFFYEVITNPVPLDLNILTVDEPGARLFSSVLTSHQTDARIEAELRWKSTVGAQLKALQSLESGWDSYHARVIDLCVIERTKTLVDRLARPGVPVPSVVPTVNGTVQLEWHTTSFDAEIETLDERVFSLFVQQVGEPLWEGTVNEDEAVTRLITVLA